MSSRQRQYAEIRKRFSRVGPVRVMGMGLARLGPGRATLTLVPDRRHSHSGGTHGGVLAALADTALAMALLTRVSLEDTISTVEMTINYLASHRKGRLRAEARVLRVGKRLAVGEVEIYGRGQQLVAKSLLTYSIRRSVPPED